MKQLEESAQQNYKNDWALKGLSYEERLIRCGLRTLEKRRSREELIGTYKIITGKEALQLDVFFK